MQSLMRCPIFRNLLSDRTDLGYDFSSPSIASTSTIVFVPPSNNIESENNDVQNVLASKNIDKGKSILGAPLKQDKKEIKNPRAKKGSTQKPKQKKQHLCHHCGVAGHTQPNCYKWLPLHSLHGSPWASHEKCDDRSWNPVKSSKSGASFSHLVFADDLVLFAKADYVNCMA